MTGSSWKSNLDPQIATRNRWTDQHGARPSDVVAAHESARAGAGHAPGARNRGLAAAAAVALTVAAVVMFVVVALSSAAPQPLFTTAPGAPAEHSAPASPAAPAGGSGSGHAVAE